MKFELLNRGEFLEEMFPEENEYCRELDYCSKLDRGKDRSDVVNLSL